MVVCGETGVGKTHRNKQEIKRYLLDNPSIGKKGRKVLAFDTNDDDYSEFRTVNPNYLKALTAIACRRIRPFNPDGSPMDDDQKKEVVYKILKHYKNGMVVLDDIDNYMVGAKGQSMIGALCTVRHKGIDLLLTHQSIAKISPSEWQNCTWLRLHHQVDDATSYRKRIPKYQMVRIAQLIVDEQYSLSTLAYLEGKLPEKEYEKQKSFFVYVNMRQRKIMGCSRAAFIRACKRFIDQEEGKKVRMLLQERDFKGKLKYKNRNAAIIKMISDYTLYHQPNIEEP
ncbi:hypothetical protein HN014_10650 [Aquimarina sp. TRL1]|nr:hypothetical protein HN014_10650 [Aquimarina sp. TRL1]